MLGAQKFRPYFGTPERLIWDWFFPSPTVQIFFFLFLLVWHCVFHIGGTTCRLHSDQLLRFYGRPDMA